MGRMKQVKHQSREKIVSQQFDMKRLNNPNPDITLNNELMIINQTFHTNSMHNRSSGSHNQTSEDTEPYLIDPMFHNQQLNRIPLNSTIKVIQSNPSLKVLEENNRDHSQRNNLRHQFVRTEVIHEYAPTNGLNQLEKIKRSLSPSKVMRKKDKERSEQLVLKKHTYESIESKKKIDE